MKKHRMGSFWSCLVLLGSALLLFCSIGSATSAEKGPIKMGMLLPFTACSKKDIAPMPPYEGAPRPYRVNGDWYQPLASARAFRERGLASWYGKDFHGKKTSSGEVYDMYAMTAAHKILPLGTYVRVRNLENGRVADVRINDRGPFVRGRIIDLSYTAARKLGVVGPGTARVEVTALGAVGTGGSGAEKYVPVDLKRFFQTVPGR